MTGRFKGLMARIRDKNPEVQWNHCVIHREALEAKKLSPVLHDVLNNSIKVINFIKSRPLNARLFHRLCEDMGAEHTQLLLCTQKCTEVLLLLLVGVIAIYNLFIITIVLFFCQCFDTKLYFLFSNAV